MYAPRMAFAALGFGACIIACAPLTRTFSRDRDVITAEEVRSAQVSDAHELVQRLRPLWLQSRGDRSLRLETAIVVYVDGSMLGELETLRTIPIEIVDHLEVLDSAEAMKLPGLGSRHVERAILVTTRPPG